MIALVLSGGGSRGALQAGAVMALLEHDIWPDLIVGTSVGAINGAALASLNSLEEVKSLAQRWRTVGREDIFPGNSAKMAWRLLSGRGSFHPSGALRRFIMDLLPPQMRRFKHLRTPLLVTATVLRTGLLHIFGTDPEQRLVDSLMASCAIPPLLSPWRFGDELYVDGGVVANLPLATALERGATTIYAIEIGHDLSMLGGNASLRSTIELSIQGMLQQQMQLERELVRLARREGVEVHYLPLFHYSGLPHDNFDYNETLLELGHQSVETYLRSGALPETIPVPPIVPARERAYAAIQRGWAKAAAQRVALNGLRSRLPLLPRTVPSQREST